VYHSVIFKDSSEDRVR